MPRGGRREGADRLWGSRDRVKRTSAWISEIATRDALAFMQTNDMQIFEGDSVAFLITVYRNERLPLRERMAGSPYERMRLTAVDMRIANANGHGIDWEAEGEAARQQLLAQIERHIQVRQEDKERQLVENARALATVRQSHEYRIRKPCREQPPVKPAAPQSRWWSSTSSRETSQRREVLPWQRQGKRYL